MLFLFRSNSILFDAKAELGEELMILTSGYFIYEEELYRGNKLDSFVEAQYSSGNLESLVPHLSGCYMAVIVDGAKKKALVIQDRWGSYPLFYCQHGDELLLGDDYRDFIDRYRDLKVDISAAGQLVSFGYVFGNKTLIDGVFEFDSAHIHRLSFNEGKPIIDSAKYWTLNYIFDRASLETASARYAELWAHRMDIFAAELKGTAKPVIIPLSAGMDSRLVAEAVDRRGIAQYNFTFGAGPNNHEILTAGLISRSLMHGMGQFNLYLSQEGFESFKQEGPVSYRITTGHFAEKNLWFAQKMRDNCDFMLTGHLGDFMAGDHLKSRMKLWKSPDEVVEYIVKFKSTSACKKLFYSSPSFKDAIYEPLRQRLPDDCDLINSYMRWNLGERQRRLIIRSIIAEKHSELPLMLLPFCDYELFDFYTRLPFELLLNSRLYRHAAVKHIYRDKPLMYRTKVNGHAMYPPFQGIIGEYYKKLSDLIERNTGGIKGSYDYSPEINWKEEAIDYVFPEGFPIEWLREELLPGYSRFLYALSEFTKEYRTNQQ